MDESNGGSGLEVWGLVGWLLWGLRTACINYSTLFGGRRGGRLSDGHAAVASVDRQWVKVPQLDGQNPGRELGQSPLQELIASNLPLQCLFNSRIF